MICGCKWLVLTVSSWFVSVDSSVCGSSSVVGGVVECLSVKGGEGPSLGNVVDRYLLWGSQMSCTFVDWVCGPQWSSSHSLSGCPMLRGLKTFPHSCGLGDVWLHIVFSGACLAVVGTGLMMFDYTSCFLVSVWPL